MLGVVQLLHRHRRDDLLRRREEVRRGLMRLRRGLGGDYERVIAAESPEQLVARLRPRTRASMGNTMFEIRFNSNPVVQRDVSADSPYDMGPYFDRMRVEWKSAIRKKMRDFRSSYKVSIRILLDQVKVTDPTVTRQKWIETQTDRVDNLSQVDTVVDIFILYLTAMMETWAANPTEGSDFVIREVLASVIDMVAVSNNSGNVRGSGMDWSSMVMGHWYPMPKWLQDKKACVVIRNEDEFCFRYCMELAWMIQHVGKPDNPHRVSTYSHGDHFDYGGIEFPFRVADIGKFLKLNRGSFPGLTIHVYYVDINPDEDGRVPQRDFEPIFPLDRAAREPGDFHVDLLTTWKEDTGEAHCMLITSMSRLLARGEAARNGKRFHCPRCNNLYWSENALGQHMESKVCTNNPACAEVFPFEERPTKRFRNFHHLIKKPFVIYADFEALILPMSDEEKGEVGHGVVDRHHPCGYAFHTECAYDKSLCKTVLRRARSADEDIGALMVRALRREAERIKTLMLTCHFPVHPTKIPESTLKPRTVAAKCAVCGLSLRHGHMDEWFKWYDGEKVRGEVDHDMKERNFRYSSDSVFAHNPQMKENNHIGWSHAYCRDKLELYEERETFIPVVFHNLRGYDGHIVLRNAAGSTIDHCIPQDGDKFMSFEMDGMRFIDSLCFLTQSLDKLVTNLARDGIGGFDILKRNMRGYSDDQVSLLMKKGIYPYEYMDSVARFDETALPPKSAFFSSLMNQGIGDAEYAHAGEVWGGCGIKTMGEYHDLYLMTDVLNLACVFERFRSICVSQSGVDPTYFYSTPGYTQEACLRFCAPVLNHDCETMFEIQLFNASDRQREMYRFCERGIRGGISMIPNRHSVANNPMMPEFDMVAPKTWIQYYDVTNLYGWAMSQPMPIGNYEWETVSFNNHWNKPEILELKDDADIGYIFEVDLEIDAEHHDRLRDYPMAPEPMEPQEAWLSGYSKDKLRECGKEFTSTKKLVCSFLPKSKYVCHYRNLKLYLKHGYKLKEVHRVLQFDQSCWLKPYIDFNTAQRAKSTSEMEKDYYKLMVNSCFGKFIQNDRKFRQVEIVTDMGRAERLVNKPTFKNKRHITDKIVAIETHKTRVTLNQAVIVGMAILDVSKVRMYDFYYSVLKDTFGDRVRLLMTDTDSLCVEIKSDDPTVELDAFKGQFDTAEMPRDHPWFTLSNKKVVGTMKDEVMVDHQWITIERFTGLRAKMYALTKTSPDAAVREKLKEKKVCKGISRSVIQNKLTYAMYETVMRDPVRSVEGWNQHTMRNIQSQNNVSYTTQITKVALTALDDKLYQVDGVRTLPYGHYSLRDVKTDER